MPRSRGSAHVAVAGESVQHEDGIVAGRIQLAPGLVGDAERRQVRPAFGAKCPESREVASPDGVAVTPRTRCGRAAQEQACVSLGHRCRRHGVFGGLPVHACHSRRSVARGGPCYAVCARGGAAAVRGPHYRVRMDEVVDYLCSGDPAISWQVLRDLTDASADDVARERARVADEGWGAQLLAEQSADGRWDGGTYRPGWADERRPFFDAWTATHFSLQQLMDFGIDPHDERVRTAITRVRENVRWEHDDEPFFEGETEPCINGTALAVAAYFGEDGRAIADTLLASQLPDGGWNCWDEDGTSASSFHSTICALEGLWAWEQSGTVQDPDAVATARRRGEEYLLERSLSAAGLRRAPGRSSASGWPPTLCAGTTTTSVPWSTSASRGPRVILGAARRSHCCGVLDCRWACGASNSPTRGRDSSASSKRVRGTRAGGSRFARCACCAGRTPGGRGGARISSIRPECRRRRHRMAAEEIPWLAT